MRSLLKRLRSKIGFLAQIPFVFDDFRTIRLATTLFRQLNGTDQEIALQQARKFASQPKRLFQLSFLTHFLPMSALILMVFMLFRGQNPATMQWLFLFLWLIGANVIFLSKASLLFNPAKHSSPFYLYMLRRVAYACKPEIKLEIYELFLRNQPEKMLQYLLPKLKPHINEAEGKQLRKVLEERKVKPHVMANLKPYLQGESPRRILSNAELKELLKAYDWHSREIQFSSSGSQLSRAMRSQFHKAEDIEHLISCQAMLLRAPEQVYCMACLHRAQLHTFEVWKWLLCPNCETADNLRGGLKTVIGVLPNITLKKAEEGQLYLHLWNRAEKQAIPAEIDELQVGNAEDSSWALAAFLQKLNNIPLLAKSKFELKLAQGIEPDAELWHALEAHLKPDAPSRTGENVPKPK